ncbi:hypothetical protein CO172_00845 [Candidatus Uhrbacteria bacterium CG_4_9_14_3_um_filter_36_7]|uniref:Uncharacterized protein n=1 Tax=Candidatus Uhrbacteria bacterium CG_4_9_14_3_um_filter_36_7 TaxID=1975033 RepID=A0A2M7XI59_9BACT|nr:MAG: hypothetical protein CO172_00845 [Candidatus Uhrbacteria bacterium CG_4_9_14_3_um_filter_36_7]
MKNKYLNIPLNHKTARFSKRAVWAWISISLFVFLICWFSVHAWFNQPDLTYIPKYTESILSLTPTRYDWPILLKDFGLIPLLENRPVTLTTIFPLLKNGKISLFFLKDGTRVLAIKSNENIFLNSTLKEYGISIQEPEKNLYFLSNKPIFLEKNKVSLNRPILFTRLGTLFFFKENDIQEVIKIRTDTNGYAFSLPKNSLILESIEPLDWPETLIAAVRLPKTMFPSNTHWFERIFKSYTNTMSRLNTYISSLEYKNVTVLFKKNPSTNYPEVLFAFSSIENTQTNTQEVDKALIQHLLAIKHPDQESFPMPNNQKRIEYILHPEKIDIQEKTVNETHILFGQFKTSFVAIARNAHELILSTDEELLNLWIYKPEADSSEKDCTKNSIAFIYPNKMDSLLWSDLNFKQKDHLFQFVSLFSKISLNSDKFKQEILFCY